MRIFIETDLEGAAGVETMESCYQKDPGFDAAYAELAKDINAAVCGAFDGGADEVVVTDGHGGQGLNFELIDARAIRGNSGDWSYLKNPFDAMIYVGAHAMAGTQNAFLDHTQNSTTWFEYKINGRPTGELGQSAMAAALHDAPIICVTGDEAAVKEAHDFFGDIDCVAVKRGIGRNKCETYDLDETRKKIKLAAERAVSKFKNDPSAFKPYKPAVPAEMLLTYTRSDYADAATGWNKSLERVGPRTVRKIFMDYLSFMP